MNTLEIFAVVLFSLTVIVFTIIAEKEEAKIR